MSARNLFGNGDAAYVREPQPCERTRHAMDHTAPHRGPPDVLIEYQNRVDTMLSTSLSHDVYPGYDVGDRSEAPGERLTCG